MAGTKSEMEKKEREGLLRRGKPRGERRVRGGLVLLLLHRG